MTWSGVMVAKGGPARKETAKVRMMIEEGTGGS